MSDSIKDRVLAILAQVDELKAKEAGLQAERVSYQEAIMSATGALAQCEEAIRSLRQDEAHLRDELTGLADELFHHEDGDPAAPPFEEDDELRDANYIKEPWTPTPHKKPMPMR